MDASSKKPEKAPKKALETPHDKFLRLAPARMEAALKKVALVGNLASPGYQCEPSEAKQIVESLNEAVKDVENKFLQRKSGKKGFSFR